MSESLNTPTVVLVHGGFADASYWVPVIKDLQAHDLPVLAPPNPLRGLAHAHLRLAPPTCRPRPSCCCSWRP
jgi:pimeloyl-ACP methyl ester carboxylesterase